MFGFLLVLKNIDSSADNGMVDYILATQMQYAPQCTKTMSDIHARANYLLGGRFLVYCNVVDLCELPLSASVAFPIVSVSLSGIGFTVIEFVDCGCENASTLRLFSFSVENIREKEILVKLTSARLPQHKHYGGFEKDN